MFVRNDNIIIGAPGDDTKLLRMLFLLRRILWAIDPIGGFGGLIFIIISGISMVSVVI